MAQVTLTLNGRNYTVACGEGEEQHLLDLAKYYDAQIQTLVGEMGQVGDTRLLMLGGLMIADQLSDMVKKVEDVKAELGRLKGERSSLEQRANFAESRITEILETATRRIDDIVQRLDRS